MTFNFVLFIYQKWTRKFGEIFCSDFHKNLLIVKCCRSSCTSYDMDKHTRDRYLYILMIVIYVSSVLVKKVDHNFIGSWDFRYQILTTSTILRFIEKAFDQISRRKVFQSLCLVCRLSVLCTYAIIQMAFHATSLR